MPRDLPTTKEEAMAQISNEISNAVYAASGLYESLEHDGHVAGNGHHIRQNLAAYAAAYAAELMSQRWSDEDIRAWRFKKDAATN